MFPRDMRAVTTMEDSRPIQGEYPWPKLRTTSRFRSSPPRRYSGRRANRVPQSRSRCNARQEGHIDAVAFTRTGDPARGDFSDAKVIRKFGDVPDDLSAL